LTTLGVIFGSSVWSEIVRKNIKTQNCHQLSKIVVIKLTQRCQKYGQNCCHIWCAKVSSLTVRYGQKLIKKVSKHKTAINCQKLLS